jgi:hypothetical protein
VPATTKLRLRGMQLSEKYKENFNVSSQVLPDFSQNIEVLLVFFR